MTPRTTADSAPRNRDVMALEVLVDQCPLRFDNETLTEHEISDRDVAFDVVVHAVESALFQS